MFTTYSIFNQIFSLTQSKKLSKILEITWISSGLASIPYVNYPDIRSEVNSKILPVI